jgi:hypothetical protein
MKRKIVKVSLSFASFNNDQFNSFVILLLVCLKTNPLFPNLPVKYVDLAALVDAYQQALAAAAIGGPKDTAALNEACDTLTAALRQIAGYIQASDSQTSRTSCRRVSTSWFRANIPQRR